MNLSRITINFCYNCNYSVHTEKKKRRCHNEDKFNKLRKRKNIQISFYSFADNAISLPTYQKDALNNIYIHLKSDRERKGEKKLKEIFFDDSHNCYDNNDDDDNAS